MTELRTSQKRNFGLQRVLPVKIVKIKTPSKKAFMGILGLFRFSESIFQLILDYIDCSEVKLKPFLKNSYLRFRDVGGL